ncbi:hypothetical protein SAY86_004552 [Trapa natans]|uniref:DUF4005 domain-containing protein n=1 Tax=Trapa natans TaxID=22666 RepID=A0AAN7MEN4_TRANT|nr:hypothetical protein SAY86_004552 [Trapa natans]
MGKKGSWFAAIKKVFVSHSKDKPTNIAETKGHGRLRKGGRKPFIPLFREPSSIEKILGDAEREHGILFRPPSNSPPRTPSFVPTPTSAPPRDSSPRPASPVELPPKPPSPRIVSPPSRVVIHHREISYRPDPSLRTQHTSATKIQAAFRGYMARRSFRALRGLVRLQGVVRGQNVRRQTMNAMKCMQLLVRVQSQVQSRRIQMLESQVRQQAQHREVESNFGKMSIASEAGNREDWDYSLLTKEEVEARLRRKVDAVIKRQRATAYAYSHKLWQSTPRSAQSQLMNIHSAGSPWWWNWFEKQIPRPSTPETLLQTPQRPRSQLKPSPRTPTRSANNGFGLHTVNPSASPISTRSSIPISPSKVMHTPPSKRVLPSFSVGPSTSNKYTRVRASEIESHLGMNDDDSLASCPPFSVPTYMAPTLSAKAKARANSNPKDRVPGTPTGETAHRRSSFPLPQGVGSFNWNKARVPSNSGLQRGKGFDKHQTPDSTGNLSADSTASLPVGAIVRKPFNRFV